MANSDRLLEILSRFTLQNFTEEWVKSCWECDFTETISPGCEVEEELQDTGFYTEHLKLLQSAMIDWTVTEMRQDEGGFWTVLAENNISHKCLIALLAHLIDIGNKKTACTKLREAAILSASNYFKLLTVPGSAAFKVFHPVLYEKCIDTVKLWTTIGNVKRKKSVSPVNNRKGKRQKGNKTRQQNTSNDIQDFDGSDEEEEELAPSEVSKLQKLILSLLKDLIFMLEKFSLRQSESSAYHTVQILAALTRQEADLFDGQFHLLSKADNGKLSSCGLAYKGLSLLCQPLHGSGSSMIHSTFKCLLPNLLMLIGDNKVAAQTIPRNVLTARDHAVNFIIYLIKNEERALSSIRTLIQHMCTKVTDRTEYRNKVAQSVVTILQEMPSVTYGKMVEWFYLLSKHAKISNRAFTLEIVSLLLSCPERQDDASTSADIAPYINHTSLLGILLARCSDIAPTVRARAITTLSQCFLSKDQGITKVLKDIVTPVVGRRPHPPHLVQTPAADTLMTPVGQEQRDDNVTEDRTVVGAQPPEVTDETPAQTRTTHPPKTPFNRIELTPFNPNLPDGEGVLSMFRRRAGDEKVNVRKAALKALEYVIRFEAPDYRRQDVDVLLERCRDPSLSVRKQAMQSLTDLLLSFPFEKPLQMAWLQGVMPLVIDRETTLQERCLEVLEEMILDNITAYKNSKEDCHKMVWGIIDIMTEFKSVDLRRYLQKACRHWARQGKIKPASIKALETHINTDNNEGAWMLLAEIAPAAPKLSHGFVLEYWEQHAQDATECQFSTLQRVLMVIRCSAKHIPEDKRDTLILNLTNRLKKFDSPPELISVTISTLSKLCEAKAEATGKTSEREAWCKDLLYACDKYLSKAILEEGSIVNEDLVIRHLFTLGEIAQLCPAQTPERVFLIVQSMIAAPCLSSLPPSQTVMQTQVPSNLCVSGESADSSGSSHISEGQQEIPSTRSNTVVTNTQCTQRFSQTQNTQPISQFQGSVMSSRIRAFAFITLGKLCLQNSKLAKKCVAALARELETSQDPTIRNNVVIIMCDLCVRYTTTADRYVSNIAACLKDEAPVVRKQTLTLITRLLQEDFLKWKGTLFFRFITTLLDENKEIAEFAEFCLVHLLLQRHPATLFHHFMECIFHFNSYEDHSSYNKFQQSEREKKLFTLKGDKNSSQRQHLYLFMLENMTDEHRFQLTAKLCQEILGGVVDGILPLNEDSSALLKDALAILSSKEIKLSSLRTKPQEDIATDEQEMAAVVIATAKKTLITQVVKKNVIENIVPIVVSLKHMLEKHRSPVLKDLMYYLRELMKDYKNEVQDILSADRQLANEIEFDMRKFEEQQEQQSQGPQPEKNATPACQANPSVKSPILKITAANLSQTSNGKSRAASPRAGSPRQVPGNLGSPTPLQLQLQLPNKLGSRDTAGVTEARKSIAGTPLRDTSLSTLAILNSAKKAMKKAQQLQQSRQNTPQAKIQQRRKSYLARDDERNPKDKEEETPPTGVRFADDLPSNKRTPTQAKKSTTRAISTPSGEVFESALDNITFHIDQNVTLIPPSPIPTSMPIRIYSNDTLEESEPLSAPQSRKGPQGKEDRDIVYMFSPDRPLPKPRKWNIRPSAPGAKKTLMESNSQSEDNEEVAKGRQSSSKTATEFPVDDILQQENRRQSTRRSFKSEKLETEEPATRKNTKTKMVQRRSSSRKRKT